MRNKNRNSTSARFENNGDDGHSSSNSNLKVRQQNIQRVIYSRGRTFRLAQTLFAQGIALFFNKRKLQGV